MGIWGKVFGTVAGFAVGGRMGAVLGAALGHAADRGSLLEPPTGGWSDRWAARAAPDPNGAAAFVAAKFAAVTGRKDQLYALCTIILTAKLAKCDAPVNRREIDAFKSRLRVPPENVAEVGRLFDFARQRTDDYEHFARELGHSFRDQKLMLEDLLSTLFFIARADCPKGQSLHPDEIRFLSRVHKAFGLGQGAWDRAETGRSRPAMAEDDAYTVLGVSVTATDDEIRATWRTLVRTHHPDTLTARNASPAEIDVAVTKISRINAAWDVIKRERRL
ncbi:TerB family tellurite resistance protein [Acetobacter fallax]|uniref:DnaJ domain-containing protein n=1 Tax=Acetobacter fallax TaxID=1737473 RepID=A0ABX0K973_9PROT|nr:TerB family tellurite resistance protein [Acetobacter fallax]NHO32348.1 DnaJ domain-containing protein [Acetobacter fallax]NHO35984.1 DnaJ domain-containing protein [Acetobacter fallax]